MPCISRLEPNGLLEMAVNCLESHAASHFNTFLKLFLAAHIKNLAYDVVLMFTDALSQ